MPEKSTKYVFAQRLPIWTYALAGLLTVGGVLALVLGNSAVWTVLGIVGIALAVLLLVLLLLIARKIRLEVTLDERGFVVNNSGDIRKGGWDEVTSVSSTPDFSRIVIRCGAIKRTYISAPRGEWKTLMTELVEDLRGRLN